MLDFTTGFAQIAASRLLNEQIIWITTVDAAGTPQPRPVWFQFNGQTILFFSQPDTGKLKHLRNNSSVSAALNSDHKADEVTVFIGEANILAEKPAEERIDEYVAKYLAGIQDLGYTPESFLAEYSVPVEVVPTRVRGF